MHDRSGTRAAAQIAFFVLLSTPAALLLVVWLFSSVLDEPSVKENVVDAIVEALPLSEDEGRTEVRRLLEEVTEGAGGLGVLSATTLLYSASGALGGLRHAMNEASGERDPRPFLRAKALDLGITFVAAPALMIGLGLTLSGSLPSVVGDHIALGGVPGRVVTDVLPLSLTAVLLVLLWRTLPADRIPFKAAAAGALIAVVGIELVQILLRLYLDVVGDGSAIYGTLGVVLVVVFSVYFDAIAVLFGVHVAVQWQRIDETGGLDAALCADAEGEPTPIGPVLLKLLRGLVLRDDEPSKTSDGRDP